MMYIVVRVKGMWMVSIMMVPSMQLICTGAHENCRILLHSGRDVMLAWFYGARLEVVGPI